MPAPCQPHASPMPASYCSPPAQPLQVRTLTKEAGPLPEQALAGISGVTGGPTDSSPPFVCRAGGWKKHVLCPLPSFLREQCGRRWWLGSWKGCGGYRSGGGQAHCCREATFPSPPQESKNPETVLTPGWLSPKLLGRLKGAGSQGERGCLLPS